MHLLHYLLLLINVRLIALIIREVMESAHAARVQGLAR